MSVFTKEQQAQIDSLTSDKTTAAAGTTGASGKSASTFDRLLNQESGGSQFNQDGSVKTSSEGAIGIAQVMPATGPEAAKLAGLPWDENRYRKDPEYNKALGRAYFEEQLRTFGDERTALAAYNAGPGATARAIARAKREGGDFLAYLPEETRKYVPAIMGGKFSAKPLPSSPEGRAMGGSTAWSQQPRYQDPGFNAAFEREALLDAADESPVSTSLGRGWEGLKHNAGLFLDNVTGDSQGAAERIKAKRQWDEQNPAPRSSQGFVEDWQRLAENNYAGMFATFAKNPGGALNQMVEQTPNSLPALAIQIPVGIASSALYATGVGAPIAMGLQAVASFVGNVLPEGGAIIEERLAKSGINPNDTAAVAKWIAENRGANLEAGIKKAGVISLVDGATGYLAGKAIVGPTVRFNQAEAKLFAKSGVNTTDKAAIAAARATPAYKQAMAAPAQDLLDATIRAQKIVREVGGFSLEAAGEGVGEYAGSYAANGEASVKDAILEGAMGAGTSAAMTGANMALGSAKGPDMDRAALEALAATPRPVIKPNSPLSNAANIGQAEQANAAQPDAQATADQPAQGSRPSTGGDIGNSLDALLATRDSLNARINGLNNLLSESDPGTPEFQEIRNRAQQATAERDSVMRQIDAAAAFGAMNPSASPRPQDSDPLASRVEAVRSFVEDKDLIRALRGDKLRYGPESVNELLSAWARARNPNTSPEIRNRALDDISAFINTFNSRPNFTFGQNREQPPKAPGQQVATINPQGGAVAPATPRDDGRTLNGEVITRPEKMAGANPNQLAAPPVLGLPTEQALNAKRDADAAYEQAYQDLVKAEQLGESDAQIMARQQAIRDAREAQEQADARLKEIEQTIDGNRAQQTAAKRRAVLDAILADPATANPAARLAAELKRQGFRDTTPTQAELDTIQRFSDIKNAEAELDIIPSSPNELDPYQVRQERPQQPAKPRLTVEQIKRAIANGATLSKDVLTLPDGSRVKLKGPQIAAAREAIRKAQPEQVESVPAQPSESAAVTQEAAPQQVELQAPVSAKPAETFDVSTRTDDQLRYLAEKGKDGWREAAQAELAKRTPAEPEAAADPSPQRVRQPNRNGFPSEAQYQGAVAVVAHLNGEIDKLRLISRLSGLGLEAAQVEALTYRMGDDWTAADTKAVMGDVNVSLANEGKTTQPAEPEAENVDPLDKEISDAAAHLADVLADVFGAKLNITGPQHTAADLLPAMQKVIGLLIQKGFKTFSQAVGQTARMLRDNGAGDHVEKITPRQWKAAYQFAADMPGVEGAESEEAVAALSADKVLAIVSGHVDKARAEAEARTDTNPSDAPAQPAETPDVSTRTDDQLQYLANNGKPGWKEAAQAEMARREGAKPEIRSDLDAAAHEAATSPLNDTPQPTDGQKSAGNYKVGRVRVQGMDISIENPKGSVRSGTSPDGKQWSNTLHSHYGYFTGTKAADGDHLDVYLADGAEDAPMVWVIDQKNADGTFDEHKVVLGPRTEDEAKAAYLANYDAGWNGIGAISSMPIDAFKSWAFDGKKKRKPLVYVVPKKRRPAKAIALVLRVKENYEDLVAMADDAGWQERGGYLLRDASGEVAGRTKWLPRAEWFVAGMEANPDVLRTAIERINDGNFVVAKSRRTVEGMVEWLEAQQGEVAPEDRSAYDYDPMGYLDVGDPAADFYDSFDDLLSESPLTGDEAMRALGFTEDEINEAANAGRATASRQGKAGQAEPDSAQAGRQADRPGDGEQGNALESYTEQDLAARDEAQRLAEESRAKAERDADNKARADADRDTFTLTGSDRPADVLAAQGQGGLFDAAAPVTVADGRLSSEEYRNEGKSPADLIEEKADYLGRQLAMTIAEEASQKDFAPSEIPSVVRMWANDERVPADSLRIAVLKHLPDFGLSDGRIKQIRNALSPLNANNQEPVKNEAPANTGDSADSDAGNQEPIKNADLASIFTGLASRGLAKSRAKKAAEAHPRAAQIAYVQDNFHDILTELEDKGLVKINCD